MMDKHRTSTVLSSLFFLLLPRSPVVAAQSPPQFIQTPAVRGYDFTISASSTDSHVTQAPPAGGVRELYLWVTCSTPGMSAVECQVSGTLPILGFTALNGVMNVGTNEHLVLAVPGCPAGSAVDHLLGKWNVNDQGGSLCLGAPQGAAFSVVDCATPIPAVAYDPQVTGFSSNGDPCDVGQQGCFESEPAAIVFEETATASGQLAYGQPWSPDGSWVAVTTEGSAILVAPTGGSRRTLDAGIRIHWSPDGSCVSSGSKALVIVRASDGATRTLGTGEDFTHQVSTGDGRVHSWIGDGTIKSFARSSIWQPPEGYAQPTNDVLVSVALPNAQRNTVRRFSLGTARESTFVAGALPTENELLLMASGTRLPVALVMVVPTASFPSRTVLLSVPTGETLLEFAPLLSNVDPGFFGTSLAHDDQWIIGQVQHSSDGEQIDRSDLWIASRTGRWLRSIGGITAGSNPQSPARGDWLAFNDLTTNVVHVGRLRIIELRIGAGGLRRSLGQMDDHSAQRRRDDWGLGARATRGHPKSLRGPLRRARGGSLG